MLTAAQKTTLKNELLTDPFTLGYAQLLSPVPQDAALAELLNALPAAPVTGRKINRTTMPTAELLECLEHSEYVALTAANRDLFNAIVSIGEINPAGSNVVATLGTIFPSGQTRARFLAARERACSRAEFLALPVLTPSDVADARLS